MNTPPFPVKSPPPKPANAPPSTATPVVKIDMTNRKPKAICPRIVFYAGEKFGKTTFAAGAPDPIILMARGETGYDTLLSAGLVPAIPAIEIPDIPTLLGTLDALIENPQGRKTVILDAISGFDQLTQELVCKRDFKGDWNDPRDGFLSYGADKGYKGCANEWKKVLSRLDRLNNMGLIIVLLGHAKVQAFKNPLGSDYDTFQCDMSKYAWAETARWSDCILFGKFYTVVDGEKKGKGKGIGGTDRIVYTDARDAFTAGNRYGMPEQIELSNDHTASWAEVWKHIVKTDQ